MLKYVKNILLFFLLMSSTSCISQSNHKSILLVDEEKQLSPNTCLVIAKVISISELNDTFFSATINISQVKKCGSSVSKKPNGILENVLIQKSVNNNLKSNEEIEGVLSIQIALGDIENYYIYNYNYTKTNK